MNKEILKRLKAFNNIEAIKTFFSLLKKFIEGLKLSPDNEKFSLNIRNDSRKRISVNLNGRLVFALQGDENNLLFLFMVYENDINILTAFDIVQKEGFKDNEPLSYQIIIPAKEITEQNTELGSLINAWLKACKEYESTQERSQYRKYHIAELYEMVFNVNLLEEYLNAVEQVPSDVTIWKLGCNWGEGAPDFYDYIRENNIVITHEDYLFSKGDLVLVTRGFNAYAIAKVSESPKKVITNPELEKPFSINDIDYNEYVYYATSEWLELPQEKQFEYQLRKGIRKIQQPETRERVLRLWNSRFEEIDSEKENNIMSIAYPLNQILFGPPGTGKTYHTIDIAVKIAAAEEYVADNHHHNKEVFDRLLEKGSVVFTTFHQSMSYEDFVEGIKPKTIENKVFYQVEGGIFKLLCEKANKVHTYIVKIDDKKIPLDKELFSELYRRAASLLPPHSGNTSEYKFKTIEGYDFELFKNSNESIVVKAGTKQTNMTLSLDELTKVLFENKIPFYKSYANKVIEEFILKGNELEENKIDNTKLPFVLIIDEINRGNVSQIFGELITLIEADKRLGNKEALEVTLPYSKENFGVPPNLYILGTMNTADRSVEALDTALRRRFSFVEMPPVYDLIELNNIVDSEIEVSCGEILKIINNRIEKLLDKDHLIGHSYFMAVNEWIGLQAVFQHNIIPLLQEYFFGDYGKIGLILGSGFFDNSGKPMANVEFAKFDNYNGDDFNQREIYRLKDVSKMDEKTFTDAIKTLLNRKIEQE
jgi:flavodoxin